MAAKPYNGHPSWNAWNVALWLGNDYGLYSLAMDAIRQAGANGRKATPTRATNIFFAYSGLQDTKTPDGARYSFASTRHALAGLME